MTALERQAEQDLKQKHQKQMERQNFMDSQVKHANEEKRKQEELAAQMEMKRL